MVVVKEQCWHQSIASMMCVFMCDVHFCRNSCRSQYFSPLDDLAFDMYQDPDVAQVIRKLEKKKRDAVSG